MKTRTKSRLPRPFPLTLTSFTIALTLFGHFANGTTKAIEPPLAAITLPEPLSDQHYLQNGRSSPSMVELGRSLFFDPILSGNRNISCGTCHDPSRGLGDGLALGLGEGATGMGASRLNRYGVLGRVPRNAQPLYNIGAREYRSMFHDGRLEPDSGRSFRSGFWSPAREHLPAGLSSVLAAQAMFPVLSPIEMAGHKGENAVATAVAEERLSGPGGAWSLLADRLRENPGYLSSFQRAFSDVESPNDLTFVHVANALAAFQMQAFRSDSSPFDHVLRSGSTAAIGEQATRGMQLFYGKARCSSCHSGALLTDHRFHAIAMPQIGPGKQHGQDAGYWRATGFTDRLEDEGRYRVTFDLTDLFAFRTPSLRNVALTGPWGHDGAYTTLESVVQHHLNPVRALNEFRPSSVSKLLPAVGPIVEQTGVGSALIFRPLNPARRDDWSARDSWVQSNPEVRMRIARANTLSPIDLSAEEVADLLAFLHTLTDPTAIDRSYLVPRTVPSGLTPQPAPAVH